MSRHDRGTFTRHIAQGQQALGDGPYRIATVAELTNVPEATLRAWERRYGIPRPERTAAGYRLYGVEQVRQVLEMRRLCEGGVAAAEAAKLLLARASPPATPSSAPLNATADAYATMVDAMLSAIDAFDDDRLEDQLRRLKVLGGAAQLLDHVIGPVLVAVGDRWHSGDFTIAQEHFATQKLGAVLRDLIRLSPGASARECALVAGFADDEHEIGLLGFALRVADWGTRPIILGARTPPSAVRSAVEVLSPKVVGLSVTLVPARPRARELLEDYAAACGSVPWIVGGSGATGIADLITKNGGRMGSEDPSELRALVQPLLLARTRGR